MSHVFLERRFNSPVDAGTVLEDATDSRGCCGAYRVDWQHSLLATDGSRLICWFQAPDAESARIALRQAGADTRVLWAGTVHEAPSPEAAALPPSVVVTRRFAEPVTIEAIQAIEDAGAWCLETYRVRFVRTFFSLNRQRMVCLYHAPDAECAPGAAPGGHAGRGYLAHRGRLRRKLMVGAKKPR